MKQEIWHGDCLELMKKIPDGSVDMVLTSPPYDDLRSYNDSLLWNEAIWKDVLNRLYNVLKIGGCIVWVVSDSTIKGSESGTSFKQALYAKEIGFNLHDTMIWQKSTFSAVGALKWRYAPVFEYMFIFSKGSLKTFNPIKDRENKCFGQKYSGTVRQKDGSMKAVTGVSQGKSINQFGQRFNIWNINEEKTKINKLHPATFPITIANDHIISWSNEGDLVLDPFAGSGTTLLAAKNLNRQFIGIEKEKEYYDICLERLK